MKKETHPEYGPIVFRDNTSGMEFLTESTLVNDKRVTKTIEWKDGNTYPLYEVDITSASHPFYTGKRTVLDSAGQVGKFERRYGKHPSVNRTKAGK